MGIHYQLVRFLRGGIFPLVLLALAACAKEEPPVPEEEAEVVEAGQLYNMSFDRWSTSGNVHVCYGSNASASQRQVWDSANSTTAALGKQTTFPESEFVAVPGEGKHAVRLTTQKVMGKMAAGNLFTGRMVKVNILKSTATMDWGTPFSFRPVAMEGYACYHPSKINFTQSPYNSLDGETDTGHVFVILADWGKAISVTPPSDDVDIEGDPAIIAYGKVVFDHEMDGYEKFRLELDYRNDRTPTHAIIVASSSALGAYFTGGTGSTLYLDEFSFVYPE